MFQLTSGQCSQNMFICQCWKNKSGFASTNLNSITISQQTEEGIIKTTVEQNVFKSNNFKFIYCTQYDDMKSESELQKGCCICICTIMSTHFDHWRIGLIKFLALRVWCGGYLGFNIKAGPSWMAMNLVEICSLFCPAVWRWTFPLKSNRWNTVKGFYFTKYIFSPVDFSVDVWKLFWIKFAHKCRSHSEHLEAAEQENLMTSLRRRHRRTQIKNIWRHPFTLNIA